MWYTNKMRSIFQTTCLPLYFISIIILVSANSNVGKRLIKIRANESAKWVTEAEMKQILRTVGFFDLTRHGKDIDFPKQRVGNNSEPYPTSPRQRSTVATILKNVNIERVEKFMKDFSGFQSRHHKMYNGPGSANEWLLSEVQAVVNNYTGVATVETMGSDDYQQKNIIAKLKGTDPKLKSEIVILGAHQDSINYAGETERAPGADDNASGSGVVFEILRAILQTGVKLKRTLEFHWYAAEEVGVLGSDTVSETYRNTSRNVIAMLNLDCLGYVSKQRKTIGIYHDGADKDLSTFTRMITDNYSDYKWKDTQCGYYCSDHACWQSQGYPAIFVAEVQIYHSIHSAFDTMEIISFEQIYEFCKLALAFGIELTTPAFS